MKDKFISETLSRLGRLRDRCISENRDPSKEERFFANGLLSEINRREQEISRDKNQDYFDEPRGYPSGHMQDDEGVPTYRKGQKTMTNKSGEYRTFGDQLVDIAQAGRNGIISGKLQRAATGLGESVPSEGGFLIEPSLGTNLLTSAFDSAVIAPMCWKINIPKGSNSIKLAGFDETSRADGSRFGGVLSYWLAEAAEKQASKPKFRQIELSLNKLVGLCYATDEILSDSNVLGAAIRRAFTEEISFRIDDAILNGSGAGQPLGCVAAGGTVTVGAEVGQAAASFVWENCVKMWSRLLPKSQKTAVWLVHPSVLKDLYSMALSVGTGGVPVFMPAGGASNTPYASLFGRPLIPCEQCQSLGTAGDVVLGDFKNGYILADKNGIQEDVSIHVRYIYDESVFRFVYRLDGQPTLASAITPFNSTDTLSHIVILEDRS